MQFLASLGYTVLQVDFHFWQGVSGYFTNSPYNKSTLTSDFAEIQKVLNWAVKQGVSKTDNACILSFGYSSFAAYQNVMNNPGQFKCMLNYAGMADLIYFKENAFFYLGYELLKFQLGSDDKLLKEKSPINHLEKLNLPVLLLHGENDRYVRVNQSRRMYKELQDADKDVSYIELHKGHHALISYENRAKTLKSIEAFLQKYLRK